MPPQCSTLIQQRLLFAPTSLNLLNLRGTPRRNHNTIQNYTRPKRIDEIIENPIPTPRYTHPLRPIVEDDDYDIDIADVEDDEGEQEVEEEVTIDQLGTPTRRNIPSTVVVKTKKRSKKPRKPWRETTWT
jgi:hypothetical protein